MTPHDWLRIVPGEAPLLVSFPHTGTTIPAEFESDLVSPWLSRRDADWFIDRLYDFAEGATIVHTSISRTVIDVNRDPLADHCTQARRRRNSARPAPSTASRSIRTASAPTPRLSRTAAAGSSIRTIRP
jgi:N-formylglutamate amidohydrolase